MTVYRFLHSIVGEYTVKLSCADPLPFLRRLTLNKVLFWSLRGGDGVWYLKTTLSCGELLLNNAREAGISVIALGHYASETVGPRAVMEKVAAEFALECEFIDQPTGL